MKKIKKYIEVLLEDIIFYTIAIMAFICEKFKKWFKK